MVHLQRKKLLSHIQSVQGSVIVPGDKSISHRAVMFGAVAEGKTTIRHFLKGEDCLHTIACFRKLGVQIDENKQTDEVIVNGNGWAGLKEPLDVLNIGNSGTSMRLMLGLLAGRPFHTVMIGDESIAKRPMNRVTEPLAFMGADIVGRDNGSFTPLSIRGKKLHGITYTLPVASAQVKSAILLAGLQAEGETTIIENAPTRDHTEQMIKQFGGQISKRGKEIPLPGKQRLRGTIVHVPGDISSAAFFIAAALIVPNSKLKMPNVGLNPTRTGILDVLKEMGANIELTMDKEVEGEPRGTIIVHTSSLEGVEIGGEIIPRLIDELPIIALLATQAEGKTVIKDAEELKVKETNRIDAVVNELKKLGADIEPTVDGMIIHGKTPLTGGTVKSYYDHRIGMMLSIAALCCSDDVYLEGVEAIPISYPSFFHDLEKIAVVRD